MTLRPAFIAFLLASLMVARSVDAQTKMPALHSGEPSWSSDEIEGFIIAAGIEEDDAAGIIRALHGALAAAHAQGRAKLIADNQAAYDRESRFRLQNPEVRDPRRELGMDFGRTEAWLEWIRGFDERETAFLDDVQTTLGEKETGIWRQWRRDMHRRHILFHIRDQWGRQPGFRSLMNLTDVLDEMEFEPAVRTELVGIEAAYSESMENLLANWYAYECGYAAGWPGRDVPRLEPGRPADEQRALTREWLQSHRAKIREVVAVNDSAIASILASLPGPERIRFQDGVDRARFPDIFRRCPVEIVAELLRTRSDIEPGRLAEVEQLWESYAAERDALRRRIVLAFDRWETPIRIARYEEWDIEHIAGGPRVDEDPDWADHPAGPLLRRALDLAVAAGHRIRATVAPEQTLFDSFPADIKIALSWWETDRPTVPDES